MRKIKIKRPVLNIGKRKEIVIGNQEIIEVTDLRVEKGRIFVIIL